MRVVGTVVALLLLAGSITAQAPTPKPYGTLNHVMRGILFPNSNVIFEAESEDPGASKPAAKEAGKFNDIYTGWPAVENSAVALSESAAIIALPGRLCENGKPVPVKNADFVKFAQGLIDAGQAALKAAKAKNMDAMAEASGQVADACAACHEVYRDKPGGPTARCTP